MISVLCLNGDKAIMAWLYENGQQKRISLPSSRAADALMFLAETYPTSFVAWYDERLEPFLDNIHVWPSLIKHPFEVLHIGCIQGCDQIAPTLGFVDFESPFLLPGPTDRRYPTWLISTGAGIGAASVIRAIGIESSMPSLAIALFDFGYRGIQKGVYPYSEPSLLSKRVTSDVISEIQQIMSCDDECSFIHRNFGRKWVIFWLLANIIFLKRFILCRALINIFRGNIDRSNGGCGGGGEDGVLDNISLVDIQNEERNLLVDVVIPTLGRPQYLKMVLDDLANQTIKPHKVIIVDQTQGHETDESYYQELPFIVDYLHVPWMNSCTSRNIGFDRSESKWILLLDDDVRLNPNLVKHLLGVAYTFHVDVVTSATYLNGQDRLSLMGRSSPHVWWAFAGGASLLSRKSIDETGGFDEKIIGYGEDSDYGIRLRKAGNNVVYTSAEPILHFKAPYGGFRQYELPWWKESIKPSPSPTVLYMKHKHYSAQMLNGYCLYHFLKTLGTIPIYRWIPTLLLLIRKWRHAVMWSEWLARQSFSQERS